MSFRDLGRHGDRGSTDSVNPEPDAAPRPEFFADHEEATDQPTTRPRKRIRRALRKFFLPPHGSQLWRRAAPWATAVVILIGLVIGIAYGWTWSNSPGFCGTLCHTMPPEYAAYELSPHSRVNCVECHIGRGFIGQQLARKSVHLELLFRTVFGIYKYPIYATSMRPARDACETCHAPAKFSNDSVVVKQHYIPDEHNTSYSITLVLKTGGGTQQEGLGLGIHWHIENKVQFISTDSLDQTIPYVRVTKADGSVEEYVSVDSGFDTSKIDPSQLKTMDCITCHNRVAHPIANPVDSVESSMSHGVISNDIPYIRQQAVKALTTDYSGQEQAFAGIAQALDSFYKTSYPDFYATGKDKIQAAIAEVQRIYSVSVFQDQQENWNTHPDNVGHIESAGCFRCHDGKHLNADNQAIRLECNLCHSIPAVSSSTDLVTNVEIPHAPEPASHLSPNWISLHNIVYLTDKTCSNCHTMGDDGGTSDTSFCSNSACHGIVYTYAGFDAPALRNALKGQLPTPSTPTTAPSTSGQPTWDSSFGQLFTAKCGSCHGATNPKAGLNLTTYAGIVKGGNSGPVILPGNSPQSKLVEIQSNPHFANLSTSELDAVKKWIDAGAPEK